jgi:hypothetical protein
LSMANKIEPFSANKIEPPIKGNKSSSSFK